MLQIGALRPKNFDEEFKNTFYVGASTIPGAGLPMAVISSNVITSYSIHYTKLYDTIRPFFWISYTKI